MGKIQWGSRRKRRGQAGEEVKVVCDLGGKDR